MTDQAEPAIQERGPNVLAVSVAAVLLLLTGCGPPLAAGVGGSVMATTGPSQSLISMFPTEAGLVVVGLGWWGADDELRDALIAMDADSSDVAAVFLTHAHRDHITAWKAVRTAPFYLAEAEEPYLFDEAEYEGWIPRMADRLVDPDHPLRGDIEVRTFASDTAIVIGADTIYAFLVPGHTPGSTAYLIRGVLFAGDAVARTLIGGFRRARGMYSDDSAQAQASLQSLFERLEGHDVRFVCTDHGRCAEYTEAFRSDALGGSPSAHPSLEGWP